MSGGQLVVLDRLGREVKRYPLQSGLATLGRDPRCNIRVMLPTVCSHHATVVVHANQTVVRNVGEGETLVNGVAVSVAALRHGDLLGVGERSLRWEYAEPAGRRSAATEPALYVRARAAGGTLGRSGRARHRGSASAPPPPRSPALQLAIEMQHRASMPANAGGKQVAVVQPQRRDTTEQNDQNSRPSPQMERQRTSNIDANSPIEELSPRKSGRSPVAHSSNTNTTRYSSTPNLTRNVSTPNTTRNASTPNTTRYSSIASTTRGSNMSNTTRSSNTLNTSLPNTTRSSSLPNTTRASNASRASNSLHTTKAEQWIESRKISPRRSTKVLSPGSPVYLRTASASAKKSTPLRLAVLRRAQSAHKRRVTKIQAPLTVDHTKQAAIMLMTRTTPKPTRPPPPRSAGARRSSKRGSGAQSMSILEISESSRLTSPTPMKSALKNPAAKQSHRKTESIKFDLSNLENYTDEVLTLNNTTQGTYDNSVSEDDLTLHYPDTPSVQSPSPRKSIYSRNSRILEKSLGNSLLSPQRSSRSLAMVTPDSPRRKSNRSSLIVQKVLQSNDSRLSRRTTKTLTDNSYDTTVASAFQTRTLSPRSPKSPKSPNQNLETYSIIDLVSMDSNDSKTSTSVYNSVVGSTRSSSFAFGTPQNSIGRKTRSTIDPNTLIGSSTPYVGKKTRNSLQNASKSSIKARESTRNSGSPRKSKFTTPENTESEITFNNTKMSRPSKSRSRITESILGTTRRSKSLTTPENVSKISVNSTRLSRASKNGSNVSGGVILSGRRSKSLSTPENSVQHVTVNTTRTSRPSKNRSRINKSVLVLSDNSLDDASPRSSRRVSRSSKSNQGSPIIGVSPTQRKSSRRTGDGTSTTDEEPNAGISTPENRHSPQEIGTPILSIQSLLDSSQSSLKSHSSRKGKSANAKRRTIGVIRSEPRRRTGVKSKSLNFQARRGLLRLREDSFTEITVEDSEKMVTPKSAVKLVQEAVKNKHSTAKKPQSKRTIIDNLDESDFVKQLFNSPVKRKLSQSMTEFSRKQLFDDDDEVPRRPTRNTIAGTIRTPDSSISDLSEAFTPEVFVSPISTPRNSPNLTGIKRLFSKNTPNNDLSNVRGVKSLLKTPRTRRSIKNDLSNVAGVKQVFAKSPKNRLSDVRVKEIFVHSPKNDLRRVSGVKKLFHSQKERQSPRNNLSDVRGVKNLFAQKSPENDLRRVSGVKRALQRNSPKNDLSDVRGVKRMFRHQKERSELNDVSGIEELFNESNNSVKDTSTHSVRKSEVLFDQLLGKPPIKAVYSKSFVKKPAAKPKTRSARSLHTSLDVITTNVEDWIEQELQKRLQKDDKAKSITRELQYLKTDTLEGVEPIRTSRARVSTVLKTSEADLSERKKSASELYSAHTLPIKKRSIVRASGNASKAGECGNSSKLLPIKKRVVVHSTPVKGRGRLTMNASELGRVSPIAVPEPSVTSELQTLPMAEPKTRGGRAKKASPKAAKASPRAAKASSKASPKAAKASPKKPEPSPKSTSKVASPQPRSTRARGNKANTSQANTKKRITSLVITKKSPIMSPKPAPEKSPANSAKPARRTKRGKQQIEAAVEAHKVTPKKTRATRKLEDKPATPKCTRAQVQKATVVVAKQSPQFKPQAKSKAKVTTGTSGEAPKARGKKETVAKVEILPRRALKTTAGEKTIEQVESQSKRQKIESPKESQAPKRTRRNAVESKVSLEPEKSPVKKRGRKTQIEEKPEPKNTRNTKAQEAKTVETVETEKPKATRTRGRKPETQESVQSAPTTRARRGKNEAENKTVIPEVKSRKRKSTAEDVIPSKITKVVETKARKGRKTTTLTVETETVAARHVHDSGSRVVRPRSAGRAAAPPAASSGRAIAKETVPKTNSRKKKTEAEVTPVEPASKKLAAAPRTRAAARRRAAPPVEPTATGRSRRR